MTDRDRVLLTGDDGKEYWEVCVYGRQDTNVTISGIQMCVLASDMSDPEFLGFEWSVDDFSAVKL